MLGHQVVLALGHSLLQGGLVLAELVQQLAQDLEANLFGNAARLRVEGDKLGHVHHAVGENLDALPVHIHDGLRHPSVLQFLGLGPGQGLARLGNDLTGAGSATGAASFWPESRGHRESFLLNLYRPTADRS